MASLRSVMIIISHWHSWSSNASERRVVVLLLITDNVHARARAETHGRAWSSEHKLNNGALRIAL